MAWQTKASDSILKSQEFWRLTKIVESPGDIFEQDVSALAIAIGPDSDIAKVKVTYYDPLSTSSLLISEGVIATGAPFSGRLDALLATPYPNTGNGPLAPFFARVLFSLDNIVDADFEIGSAGVMTPGNTFRAPTVLDLISYVSDPRGVVPLQRPPKEFNFDTTPQASSAGHINFVIPYFGRRSATINVVGFAPAGTDIEIFGVSINEGFAPGKNSIEFIQSIVDDPYTLGANYQINANDHGLWDYLVLNFNQLPADHVFPVGSFRVKFTVSDEG